MSAAQYDANAAPPEQETWMELLMRFSPAALAAAAIMFGLSSTSNSQMQSATVSVDPISLAFVEQGKSAAQAGKVSEAIGLYETALAVDPRNRTAYRLLADAALTEGLPGKAIGYYRSVLAITPNDPSALAGQGRALVQKGAMEKARENLARLRSVCKTGCAEIAQLDAAIAAGPPQPKLAIEAVKPKPVGETAEPTEN